MEIAAAPSSAPAAIPMPTPVPQRDIEWAWVLPLSAARLPASVSAVKATAVILDFVMVVSNRLNWGGVEAAIPIGRAGGKRFKGRVVDSCVAPQNGDKLRKCEEFQRFFSLLG